jgi:hypothetical protein
VRVRKLASDVKRLRRKRVWCEKNWSAFCFGLRIFFRGGSGEQSVWIIDWEETMGGAVLFEGAKESPAFRLMTQMVCVFPLLPFLLLPLLFFLYSLASFSAGFL